ncbi:hypothetical protein [Alloprevotella rava]|uniref:Uncharacterized protein n=1 Tax=Alloprevotella rava TaxID=671218 RepID=A0A7W5UGP1_9BACT|nr:hypothetical protein [Alloprevotella rava]MBB3701565.1 hypothetical protein [Alloprevotella rava]
MAERTKNKPTPKQRRSMQYSEDIFQLFETIHELISFEFDQRGLIKEKKPPKNKPPIMKEKPPEKK